MLVPRWLPLGWRLAGMACWALVTAPGRAQSEAPVLTVEDAVRVALEKGPAVERAVLDLGRAEDSLAALEARRFPSLTVNLLESQQLTRMKFEFDKGAFGSYAGLGPIPATDTTIETARKPVTLGIARLSQPVSQLFLDLAIGARALSAGVSVSRERLRERRQTVAAEVRKTYYGILLAESGLTAAEEGLVLAREMERLTLDRVERQVSLEADGLDAKARRLQAEADVLAARNAVIAQKERLNVHLGRALDATFQTAPVAEGAAVWAGEGQARDEAMSRRPTVLATRLTVRQAELDLELEKAGSWPSVSLLGTYLSPWGTELLPKNVASVGLLLDWQVFDAGKRARDVAEKRKVVGQARSALRETEDLARVEAARQARRLAETAKGLEAAATARAAARERLRVAQDRVEHDASLAADVLQARAAMAGAEHRYREALLAHWTAKADYDLAVGADP